MGWQLRLQQASKSIFLSLGLAQLVSFQGDQVVLVQRSTIKEQSDLRKSLLQQMQRKLLLQNTFYGPKMEETISSNQIIINPCLRHLYCNNSNNSNNSNNMAHHIRKDIRTYIPQ